MKLFSSFPRQCRPSLFHNCLPHQNGMVRIIFTFLAIFGARGSRVYTLLWKKSDFYLDLQAERLNWNRFLFNVYKTYTGSKEFSFNSFFPSLLLEKWFLEKRSPYLYCSNYYDRIAWIFAFIKVSYCFLRFQGKKKPHHLHIFGAP